MNHLLRRPSLKPRVFVSLSTVVVLCLLCLAGAAIFGWWGYRSRFTSAARLERERAALSNQLHRTELERQRGAEAGRLALARTRQTEALARVRAATNVLGRLFIESAAVTREAASLKTNETGRRIAVNPDLLGLARRFYDAESPALPSVDALVQKLESARRLEQQLLTAQGTAYEPDTAFLLTTENSIQWAGEGLRTVAQVRVLLSSMTQEARVKPTTADDSSPTLEEALESLAQAEARTRQSVILEQTTPARTNAALTVAQAEAGRIIAAAKGEAEKIKREIEEARSEQLRQQTLKAAESDLKNARAAVAAEQQIDEATRVTLRRKAADARIQSKLSPFTTPGYMDAYGRSMIEKKPHAYSVLKSGGALEPTLAGLQKIADLAYTRIDKVRPRWTFQKYHSRGWRYNPQEMEMVKEAQALLSELGPVLVEMGLLEP